MVTCSKHGTDFVEVEVRVPKLEPYKVLRCSSCVAEQADKVRTEKRRAIVARFPHKTPLFEGLR